MQLKSGLSAFLIVLMLAGIFSFFRLPYFPMPQRAFAGVTTLTTSLSDGFENFPTSPSWTPTTSAGGVMAQESATVYAGSYSLNCCSVASTSEAYAYTTWTTFNGNFHASFELYVVANTATNEIMLCQPRNSSSVGCFLLSENYSSGTYYLTNYAAAYSNICPITTGVWHSIDVFYEAANTSSTGGQVQYYLDGSQQGSTWVGQSGVSTGINQLFVGDTSGTAGQNDGWFYMDSMLIDNAQPTSVSSIGQTPNPTTTYVVNNSAVTLYSYWASGGDSFGYLGYYIVGSNITGSWVNSSVTAFPANEYQEWVNTTQTPSFSSNLNLIQWEVWANGTVFGWTNTGLQNYFVIAPSLWEYTQDNFDTGNTMYGAVYFGNSFSVWYVNHTISDVGVKLRRVGVALGNINVTLQTTDSNHYPTGTALAQGSFPATLVSTSAAWYYCDLGSAIQYNYSTPNLPNSNYAVVFHYSSGNSSNYMYIYENTTGATTNYLHGCEVWYSGSWANVSTNRCCPFMFFGNSGVNQATYANLYFKNKICDHTLEGTCWLNDSAPSADSTAGREEMSGTVTTSWVSANISAALKLSSITKIYASTYTCRERLWWTWVGSATSYINWTFNILEADGVTVRQQLFNYSSTQTLSNTPACYSWSCTQPSDYTVVSSTDFLQITIQYKLSSGSIGNFYTTFDNTSYADSANNGFDGFLYAGSISHALSLQPVQLEEYFHGDNSSLITSNSTAQYRTWNSTAPVANYTTTTLLSGTSLYSVLNETFDVSPYCNTWDHTWYWNFTVYWKGSVSYSFYYTPDFYLIYRNGTIYKTICDYTYSTHYFSTSVTSSYSAASISYEGFAWFDGYSVTTANTLLMMNLVATLGAGGGSASLIIDIEDTSLTEANRGKMWLWFVKGEQNPPTYNNLALNSTMIGTTALFSCNCSDDSGCFGYIFGWNYSGTFTNDSLTYWSSYTPPQWLNITKSLNDMTEDTNTVQWEMWFEDTLENWNNTGLQSFVVSTIHCHFYFDTGGYYEVNGTLTANQTETHYAWSTVLRLSALPENNTMVFTNFTTTYGNAFANNYSITLTEISFMSYRDTTEWAWFDVPSGASYAVARFDFNPNNPQPSQTITFNSSQSYSVGCSITNYHWDWSDGSTDDTAATTITHSFAAAGLYNVTLTLTASGATTSSFIFHQVNVTSPTTYAIARFDFSPNNPIISQTITFNSSQSYSVGCSITNYHWDWSDGSTDNTAATTITHSFAASGLYNVTLTLTASGATTSNFVFHLVNVTVDLYATGYSAGYSTGYSTGWNDGNATGYSSGWIAGNSSGWISGNASGYSQGYSDGWDAGNASGYVLGYNMGWAAGNATGWAAGNATGYSAGWDAGNASGYILGYNTGWSAGNDTGYSTGYSAGWSDGNAIGYSDGFAAGVASVHYTIARFTDDNPDPEPSVLVHFDATSSVTSGSFTDYSWDFDDGSPAGSGVTVDHSFSSIGTYHVQLTATSDVGVDSFTLRVVCLWHVNPYVIASFIVNNSAPLPTSTVLFDASQSASSKTITGYSWDFGDTFFGSGVTATHVYGAAGTYLVKLSVTSSVGTSYLSENLTVISPAIPTPYVVARFRFDPSSAANSTAISFLGGYSVSDKPITLYYWDFGDGHTASGADLSSTSHSYDADGSYIVTLNVTSASGMDSFAFHDVVIGSVSGSSGSTGGYIVVGAGFGMVFGIVGVAVSVRSHNLKLSRSRRFEPIEVEE